MNQGLTAVINIELDKAKKDVLSLQEDIKKLEKQILETRKAKLISSDDTKAVATYNKELQGLSIQLKEKRLALRDATTRVKEQTAANREATKAQQQFTQAVTTSKDGVEAINSVLAKYPSSTQATAQSLEALKNRLIELRRLRFNEILNPADQKLLARQIFETTNEIRDQKTALAQLAREAKATEQANKRLSASQQQFRNQAGASNAVALEFNRIIQDAPFGIIGVGNNIQQLAGNFSALRASAGGTSAALKGALASIITPANLVLLGISAVTSAFTAYQLGVFDSKEETKEFKSEADRLRESLDLLLNSLSAINSARLEGVKSAQEEIVELQLLDSVINDTNLADEERLRAFDQLLAKYPRILGGLDREKVLVDGLGNSYEILTKALLQRSSAVAIEEKLVEIQQNKFDLIQKEFSQKQKVKEITEQIADIEAKRAKITQPLSVATPGGLVRTEAGVQFDKLTSQVNSLNDELNTLNDTLLPETAKQFSNNKIQADFLQNAFYNVNQELVALLDPLEECADDTETLSEKTDKLTNSNKKLTDSQTQFIGGIELTRKNIQLLIKDLDTYQGLLEGIKDENFKAFNQIQTPQGGIQGNQGFVQQIQQQISAIEALRDASRNVEEINKYNEELALLRDRLKALTNQDDVASTITLTKALGDAFSAMAQQISASLNISNDSLKAFVGTLLSQTPKIIGAIARTVAANRAATAEGTKLSLKQALANGIVTGTEGAKALGPIGLALLPVFVGGAMALISGAFKKAGINAPGGGAGSAIRSAGANAVGSSITGAGQSFDLFGDLQLSTFIRGTNIELVLERVNQQRRA